MVMVMVTSDTVEQLESGHPAFQPQSQLDASTSVVAANQRRRTAINMVLPPRYGFCDPVKENDAPGPR